MSEKYDGVRAVWDGASLRFRSGRRCRRRAWFTARLPAIAARRRTLAGPRALRSAVGGRAPPVAARRRVARSCATWSFDLPGAAGTFAARAAALEGLARQAGLAVRCRPCSRPRWPAATNCSVCSTRWSRAGGEGLMLHRADAAYVPGRSPALLKLKPLHDAEARVVGHVAGRGRHARPAGRAARAHRRRAWSFSLGTGFERRRA
ncbi:MAG: hypothetical protein MZW92_54860 [Comamonadaceae bacterium]|nr:hypothetical protein [Comamonadaceae bacterium]